MIRLVSESLYQSLSLYVCPSLSLYVCQSGSRSVSLFAICLDLFVHSAVSLLFHMRGILCVVSLYAVCCLVAQVDRLIHNVVLWCDHKHGVLGRMVETLVTQVYQRSLRQLKLQLLLICCL